MTMGQSVSAAPFGGWHIYEGCAFGCGAPVMRGAIALDMPKTINFDLIDTAFEDRFKDQVSDRAFTVGNAAEGVLHRILQWSALIQRLNRLPVSRDYTILSSVLPAIPTRVALPYVHPRATTTVVAVLCRAWPALIKAGVSAAGIADVMARIEQNLSETLKPLSEPGQNRPFLMQIARDTGVPVNTANRHHPIFGMGRHAIRLESTLTGREAFVSFRIARDKHQTGRVLRQAGLPGANNRPVRSLDEAKKVAQELGYPVVVKPSDKERGEGVYAGLQSEDALEWAYEQAFAVSPNLLVERHFEGWGHRLTLYKDVVLTVTRKVPAGVTGDGETDIRGLVERAQEKREQERAANMAFVQPLQIDDEAIGLLSERDLTPDSVLPEGEFVALRRKNNSIAGGRTEMLTAKDIHPDNLSLCQDAVAAVGLQVAGVDLLIPNISVSWQKSGALICEMNAKPQIGYAAADKLMKALFPGAGRVPVHVVIADDVDRILPRHLRALAKQLGCDTIADRTTLTVNGAVKPRQFDRGFDAARGAIFGSGGASLLCVMSAEEAARFGLPIGHVDTIFTVSETADGDDQTDAMKTVTQMLDANCDRIVALPYSLKTEG